MVCSKSAAAGHRMYSGRSGAKRLAQSEYKGISFLYRINLLDFLALVESSVGGRTQQHHPIANCTQRTKRPVLRHKQSRYYWILHYTSYKRVTWLPFLTQLAFLLQLARLSYTLLDERKIKICFATYTHIDGQTTFFPWDLSKRKVSSPMGDACKIRTGYRLVSVFTWH